MIIISGKEYVAVEQHDAYVASFEEFIHRTRKEPGCLDFVVAADPIEDDRVNNFDLWESKEKLDAFRRKAKPPTLTTEILKEDVKKYVIRSSGSPFP